MASKQSIAGDIARRRLYNQHLWGAGYQSPEEVVRRFAAMQSQEFVYAKWSLAQRADGVSNASVNQAFAAGTILRTHVVRPTWHFVAPADIRWMLDVTAPRINALNSYYYRQCELDEKVFAKTNALLIKSLKGGRHLTRANLATILERAGIVATGLRLGYILMRAELDAIICSGALSGKQQTYALLDERAPQFERIDRSEALAELTRRYFTSRGPATLKDYVRWSSLSSTEGRSGLEMVKSELEHEVVDGRTYWFDGSAPGAKREAPVIDLIQVYDEYVMSYSESRDVLSPLTARTARQDFTHAILLDGRLIGHWKHAFSRNLVTIDTGLFRRLSRAEMRALNAVVERYGRFMGLASQYNMRCDQSLQ